MSGVDTELADLELPSDAPPRPATPTPEIPTPTTPGSTTADPRHPGLLMAALAAIAVFALPVVLFMMALGVGPIELITAEALEHSGGLDRETFGAVWRLALAIDLGVFVWCGVRLIARRREPDPRPWRPLAWLWAGALLAVWITVPADIQGVVDIPDALTTALLLVAHGVAAVVVPAVLLLLFARLLALLWRRGRASVVAYRRIVGLAWAVSLGGGTVVVAAAVYDRGPEAEYGHHTPALAAGGSGLTDVDLDDLEQSSYEGYVEVSSWLGGRPAGHAPAPEAPEPEDHFAACARQLATASDGERAEVAKAIDRMERDWRFDRAEAEDLAMDALLKTCSSYADNPRPWIVATYWTAVRNESINRKARHATRRRYTDDVDGLLRDWGRKPDALELWADKQKVAAAREAYWRLSEEDRRIVDLRLEGRSFADIALRTGVDAPTARKRYQRALGKMQRTVRSSRGAFD